MLFVHYRRFAGGLDLSRKPVPDEGRVRKLFRYT